MKDWFQFRENYDDTYSVCPKWEEFGESWNIRGSWAVLPARLFGLDWADYLRYCRQNGADVIGKGHAYPTIKWKKKNDDFLRELNKRAQTILKLEEE